MSVTASFAVSPKEREVQEALEAKLEPSELLLGFTQCRYNTGGLTEQTYYLGLSQQRLFMLRKDQPLRIYTFFFPLLQSLSYEKTSWLGRRALKLKLQGETINLGVPPAFQQRAQHLAQCYATRAAAPQVERSTQVLTQVADLLELGLLTPAQKLLHERMKTDPVIEIEPSAAEIDRQIRDARLALWVGAGIFTVVLLFMLAMAVLGYARIGMGLLFALAALVELVRGRQAQRGTALVLALLTALLNVMVNAATGSLLDVMMWLAFGLAMVMTLTGRPGRGRMVTAAAIFLAGFFGPLALAFFMAAANIQPEALRAPNIVQASAPVETAPTISLPDRFDDDFSQNRGWVSHDAADLSAGIEDGAYAIHLKQPNVTFFAFPPSPNHPDQIAFDAQAPDGYQAVPGSFGVTCGYQRSRQTGAQPYYRVEIDLTQGRFAVLKQVDEAVTSLLAAAWQPLNGLRTDGQPNRFSARCAGQRIHLSVNGVEQASVIVSEPGDFQQGKMGLFVSTWKDTGPRGYKVLFDNAQFSQGAD